MVHMRLGFCIEKEKHTTRLLRDALHRYEKITQSLGTKVHNGVLSSKTKL